MARNAEARAARQARPGGPRAVRGARREPRASYEELEIRTSDGVALRAVVDEPPGLGLRGTLVFAHAMFARKSSFGRRDRPGLAHALAQRGFRTIAFDFRGHGESGTAGAWGYDDLVRLDLPAVVGCARARSEGMPVLVVGHSLGGHVALAAQGTGRMEADAIVALGANVWLRAFEPSLARWAAKRAIARAALTLSKRAGGIPARRLGIGSDDASGRYMGDVLRSVTEGVWRSADGRDDYGRALAGVTAPLAAVLGERDAIMCHPASGEAFARRAGGPVAVFRAPVGHMALATSPSAWGAVFDAVEWALARAPGAGAQERP